MEPFDIAVSLGINCESRYQISRILWNRKYDTDRNFHVNTHDEGTYFFDWSITPMAGLLKILQNDFQGSLNRHMMKIKQLDDGRKTVVDLFTGIEYPHDFNLNDESENMDEKNAHKEEKRIIENNYPEFREKYGYLMDKMRGLLKSDKSKLFVRCGPVSDNDLNCLADTLNTITNHYRLIYLPWYNRYQIKNSPYVLNRKEIIYGTIKHEDYPGQAAEWDKAFSGISFNISS